MPYYRKSIKKRTGTMENTRITIEIPAVVKDWYISEAKRTGENSLIIFRRAIIQYIQRQSESPKISEIPNFSKK